MQLPICGITKPMGTIGTGMLSSSKWGMGMAQKQRILWIQESIMDFSTPREMYLHITNLYHDRCVAIAIFILFRHFQLWFRSPPCEKLLGWKFATRFIVIYRSLCKKRPSATVDGRNPAPVEVGSLSHYIYLLYRVFFLHPRWWSPGFWTINSICTFSPTIWTTNDSTLLALYDFFGRSFEADDELWGGKFHGNWSNDLACR